jgi:hypothetical protein
MELAYTNLRISRFDITTLGVTAAGISAAFFVLPCAGLLVSGFFSRVIESSLCTYGILGLIRAAIATENAMIFALPVVGLAAGVAGAARGGGRCVLSAMAAAFNAVMLTLIVLLGI